MVAEDRQQDIFNKKRLWMPFLVVFRSPGSPETIWNHFHAFISLGFIGFDPQNLFLSGLFLPVFQIISLCVNWDLLHALRLISRLDAWSPTVTEFSLWGSSLDPLPMEQLHTNKVHLKQLGSAGATGRPKLPLCSICIDGPEEKATNKTASMSIFSRAWLTATKPLRFSTAKTARTGWAISTHASGL